MVVQVLVELDLIQCLVHTPVMVVVEVAVVAMVDLEVQVVVEVLHSPAVGQVVLAPLAKAIQVAASLPADQTAVAVAHLPQAITAVVQALM